MPCSPQIAIIRHMSGGEHSRDLLVNVSNPRGVTTSQNRPGRLTDIEKRVDVAARRVGNSAGPTSTHLSLRHYEHLSHYLARNPRVLVVAVDRAQAVIAVRHD